MAYRVITTKDCPPLLDKRLVGTKMEDWLGGTESPFGTLKFIPSPEIARITFAPVRPHAFHTFNGRCAYIFSTPPQLLYMVMQAEQSAMSYRGKLNPTYDIHLMGGDCNGPHPAIPKEWGDGWETIQSKNGWVAWIGQKMLVELCGAGIMAREDQKKRQTECYLGIDRQIYWTHRIASHWRDAFNAPKERIVNIINLEGKPEEVECGDMETLYMLAYTPNEKVLTERPNIWRNLCLPTM